MKIPEIQLLDNLLFKPQGMNLSNIELDAESKDYLAQTFQLDNQNIIFRKAKITPTKTGQFVTVWKRNGKGITAPFSVSDELDFIIVFRAPLKTLLWLLTCSSFQLLRCRNTHLAQLNSVFSALYLKKITALSFQTELLEMPFTEKEEFSGAFIFPKAVLHKKKIISDENKDGKRGIRVYPPWDLVTSKQALKTQEWQAKYFIDLTHEKKIEIDKIKYILK